LKRVALSIQYDGKNFSGWQRQKQVNTVQETLEEALKKISCQNIKTFASGRTDAGVHASGQVVHFDTDFVIPENKWSGALNGRLPKDVRVNESVGVASSWHACYSAIYRHYRYVINNSKLPNIFLDNCSWHRYQKELNIISMKNAICTLKGKHDFFAFQKSGSNRSTSITTVKDAQICKIGQLIFIDIKATGFLYGMVRAIVGQLVLVGENKISPDTFYQRWFNKQKEEVHESAPAKGLCFVNAVYKDNVFKKLKYHDLFPKFLISGYS